MKRTFKPVLMVRGMGETTYAQVRQEFERRIEAGEFREVSHVGAGRQYTTAMMVRMEREIVGRMQERLQRSHAGLAACAHRHGGPSPGVECVAAPGSRRNLSFAGEGCRFRWHRRRGQDNNSGRDPRRRGGRGLQGGRFRANVPRGAETQRSRYGDIHTTEASGTWTAAGYRRETALCARRILSGIDQTGA